MSTCDVAVTGLGLVSPAGIGVEANWHRVCAGMPTAQTDPLLNDCPVDISCRVPGFAADRMLGPRRARRLDRFVQLTVLAAEEAVTDSGLDVRDWDGARVGVVLGCADGGPGTVEEQHRVLLTEGAGQVSPLLLPRQLPNMMAGQVSIELGATGPSLVVATACASGATAIGLARDLLLLRRCDIVVTGGGEAMLTPLVMAGFAQMGALSRRCDDPSAASRPFDSARDGFVAGEGAGVLVLERLADAQARRARVRARIAGFGASADAHHVTSPDPQGRGAEAAVRGALADAQIAPSEVEHVNAHGSATPLNDLVEAQMLRRVVGRGALVTSTKGVTGHLFGAAGAVETAFTVLAVERGMVPPTANLDEPDGRLDIDIAQKPTPLRLDIALSTSLGFGGQNAAVLVARA
ncbi:MULTISPECIES: beta-ketoacyl-[acyl-carrier-protein] synthase family protein [unclassified Solwaraspora]|uniref:beta-ketoacyl-[acyl-carrier-protein] synthase family protein n=1 Tax=unclassified Solwaraspora TaxID=2627926 RepID=UPI00248D15C8|nr:MULTISPECIES: beta-ketoacyl-[acyl-carrier-protein] synthase family protein [unclassified Solwaraspora]WBB95641.1 beta-ketoacyl-[acyl-carrier-protein] synthase family protein [Solwaraspora sp. WMMA2059]WBC20455.1 beta-ketoacyl-[acyl-carrier-protein] synthase family protein [Solwaraspora sp. WMMA2080]WJK37392.1 beta-ketoacyl-[acyl-carrier-protein] synthase family protein [Solwaraspora sp. WMMA2065]